MKHYILTARLLNHPTRPGDAEPETLHLKVTAENLTVACRLGIEKVMAEGKYVLTYTSYTCQEPRSRT